MTRPTWLQTLFPDNAERTLPWPEVGETVTLYPALNYEYAQEIARDWNARHNTPPVGFVTAFEVRAEVATRYDIQVVGAQARHQELWVPAGELEAFNDAVVGPIRVLSHYAGAGFTGDIDPQTHLPAGLLAP